MFILFFAVENKILFLTCKLYNPRQWWRRRGGFERQQLWRVHRWGQAVFLAVIQSRIALTKIRPSRVRISARGLSTGRSERLQIALWILFKIKLFNKHSIQIGCKWKKRKNYTVEAETKLWLGTRKNPDPVRKKILLRNSSWYGTQSVSPKALPTLIVFKL